MKNIEVVAAILKYNDEVLCAQRGAHKFSYIAYKYEFPGGKIEENETKKEALARELFEELTLEIEPENFNFFMTVKHCYLDFCLTMHAYEYKMHNKNLQLQEHINLKWMKISELRELDWAEADIKIIDKLINR